MEIESNKSRDWQWELFYIRMGVTRIISKQNTQMHMHAHASKNAFTEHLCFLLLNARFIACWHLLFSSLNLMCNATINEISLIRLVTRLIHLDLIRICEWIVYEKFNVKVAGMHVPIGSMHLFLYACNKHHSQACPHTHTHTHCLLPFLLEY